MTQPLVFRLKVQQVQQTCLFDLLNDKGQHLSVVLSYPEILAIAYQVWQRAYLNFYQYMALSGGSTEDLRGRVVTEGQFCPEGFDWQAELVAAEAKLLHQFHQWLRSRELFELRSMLGRALKEQTDRADVFLVCDPLELARLPWETWDLECEGTLRFARCPANVRATVASPRRPRRRMRVLAIFGDGTGLDLQGDRAAIQSLSRRAQVQVMAWQPQQPIAEFKRQVCEAIVDSRGWDILFFAGHSDETELTGGELAIAPSFSMTIQEITPYLEQLRERGLHLAIFNSCSGLSIANALIDLGLGQVVVMREPVHNQVAQLFLNQFLQQLGQSQDAHDALRTAVAALRQARGLTYPSAHLVPSLFRHPDAALFQLRPSGLRHRLVPWVPTRREVGILAAMVCLSLWPPLQQGLLQGRLLVQAMYRETTAQIPESTAPPVMLVQIDELSLRLAGVQQRNPMDRAYLAQLIQRLERLQPQIIGLDYLLDRPQDASDPMLADAVNTAIEQYNPWFVFAALPQANGADFGVDPKTRIGSVATRLEGHIEGLPTHMTLPGPNCEQSCPFAYLLALLAAHRGELGAVVPRLENQGDLRSRFLTHTQQNPSPTSQSQFIQTQEQHGISWIAEHFGQLWLQPILDLSIPPDRVYQRVPAWKLLEDDAVALNSPVILIAPGGYQGAGVTESDAFDVPWAMRYLSPAPSDPSDRQTHAVFTGGEAHAYMVHHLLHERVVIPVPDLWMVLLAAWLGKAIVLNWGDSLRRRQWRAIGIGIGGVGVYGVVSIQLFLSASVLLPWLLPSVTALLYMLPMMGRDRYGK